LKRWKRIKIILFSPGFPIYKFLKGGRVET
jgi:hypothetical protein